MVKWSILSWSILSCLLCLLGFIPTSSSTCAPILLSLGPCKPPGTTVDSWGLVLGLAEPLQSLCIVPSTVTNSTLVISSDFCQNDFNITTARCQSLSGQTFNTSAAGASFSSSSPEALLAPNPVWASISSQALLAGTTEVQLPGNDMLPKFPIGIITGGNHQNVGHLGLANDSDFLHSARSKGLIANNGFGLNAGSQSVANPRNGGLVLGGYDKASIGAAFSNFSIATSIDTSERKCPLQVTITQLVLRFPQQEGFTDIMLISSGFNIPACIEPYDNLFRLPQTGLQLFKDATGWSSNTTADPNLYVIEPGLYYPQTTGFNGSLIFTINGKFVVEIPNSELANPLVGLNTNGARVSQPNITELPIFYENALLNTAVLGKVFLSKVYLAVDYDANQFQLAPIVSGTTYSDPVAFDSTAVCSSTSSRKSGLPVGAKVGIAIGCVFGIIIILYGIWFFHDRGEVVNNVAPPDQERHEHTPPLTPPISEQDVELGNIQRGG